MVFFMFGSWLHLAGKSRSACLIISLVVTCIEIPGQARPQLAFPSSNFPLLKKTNKKQQFNQREL